MMKKIFFLFLLGALISSCESGDGFQYVVIETEMGNMKVQLYNSTPKHRDNFVKLVKDGFYDDLLFHRIIKNFMAQGGDPHSRGAAPDAPLGNGGPGYTLDAEIGAPHFKGTLAAARLPDAANPEKKSSGSQFYIVQGTGQNDKSIEITEKGKNIQYSEEQKQKYKERGGTINLDMDYTVFGEIVEGLEVVDKLCDVQTGPGARPARDLKMKITMAK